MLDRLPNQQTSLFSRVQQLNCATHLKCEPSPIGTPENGVPPFTLSRHSQPASILVIDDEIDIRALLSNVLEMQGYQCQEASDGFMGLTLFQEMEPDLVLLDITMPRLDGFEVLKQIRRQNPTVGVIMVSALHPDLIASKAITEGADGYIAKPFRLQTLFQEIERVSHIVHIRRHHIP